MKKANLIIWGVAAAAALTILFFFLGWRLPFRLFGWVSVAVTVFFIIGVIASIKDLKKDLDGAPNPMIFLIVAAVILVGCGFIFTRDIADALLLGCSFAGVIGAPLMAWAANHKKVEKTEREEVDLESEIETEPTPEPGPSVKEFDEMVNSGEFFKIDSFVIGKVFPWKEYVFPGDHIIPDINMNGFDVVASFTDLTPQEDQAFATSEIKVSLFEYLGMPFIIMNYDDVVRLQFSINIQKMKPWAREHWVDDKENCFIRVFLLESNDGTLRGIRHFELKMMPVLKRIVATQLQMERDDIDGLIRVVEGQFDVPQMEVMAQYTEIVPRPEAEL